MRSRACSQLGAVKITQAIKLTATAAHVSRDGLVGYDAALTRLRSGVQLPLLVLLLNLSQ